MKRSALLNLSQNPKFLVVRFSSMGDVVLASVIPAVLKSKYPDAHITFLTKKPYHELFQMIPEVDETVALEKHESLFHLARRLRTHRFDAVIDLHRNLRSTLLRCLVLNARWFYAARQRWQRLALVWFKVRPRRLLSAMERYGEALKPLGLKVGERRPRLFLKSNTHQLQKKFGIDNLKSPVIGFNLGSRHFTKMWNLRSASECMKALESSSGATLVLIGDTISNNELFQVKTINLTGQTSLPELAAVIQSFSLLISVDSGPMHIAEALGVPVICLFGPTVTDFGFAPYLSNSKVVEEALPCRPCSLHGNSECPLGHHQCMENISAKKVVQEALRTLKRVE